MVRPILMPRPGQMTEECTLLAWHKSEGDRVEKGDILFEIETDKAVMEVEAFDAGVLLRRLVNEGETVPVNAVCAYIGEPGEEIPEASVPEAAAVAAAAIAPPGPTTDDPLPGVALSAPPADRGARLRISPRASRLAAEAGVDPRSLSGSGPEGRIVERDVQAAAAVRSERAAAASEPVATGPGRPQTTSAPATRDGEDPAHPLSRMRRLIAERMTRSVTSMPQFTVTVAVDVTRLARLRSELKAAGSPLTITDFVMAATARSLVEMPVLNSRTDGESVWLRRRVHLGLAVAVPNGLVVVVVRDADHLTIDEIHVRAATMAAAARGGRLSPDDMTGSTFSISNLGMFGVEHFTAIVNPGESAILAVSSAIPAPVVIGGGIAIRSIMRLTLSADHRLIDGELAARFLDDLRGRLEDPASLRTERLE
jgi:pyruvate dehydrogenase E2 component (dihydrolipoamide acetyltransferase)